MEKKLGGKFQIFVIEIIGRFCFIRIGHDNEERRILNYQTSHVWLM